MPKLSRLMMFVLLAVLPGCGGPLYRNQALQQYHPEAGYRFNSLRPAANNSDAIFVCLTFSGGGTRAAAFAYGVLLGLRDTMIDREFDPTGPRRLLDEVDMISSVSGGSFTAMGYGLWGDRLFDGAFEKDFLKQNVQWALFLNLLKPKNLLRIPFILLDRTDVAAGYYDEEIFDRHTYADLLEDGRRPFVIINATDLARRQRFSFTQDDFDLLGSDLASVPVGWAVAASSAFPLLLSPLRLKYFPGEAMTAAVERVLTTPEDQRNARRFRWAESLISADSRGAAGPVQIDGCNHQYLYLLDGGLSDNLGLTPILESYRQGAIRRKIEGRRIERFVVIIVDAATDPPEDLESKAGAPGLFRVGERTGTTAMYTHSATLAGILRYTLLEAHPKARNAYRECRRTLREHCPDAPVPELPGDFSFEPYVIDLDFRRIEDEQTRRTFLSMVTSFFLPTKDVQALIRTGRRLLLQHPEYHRLLRDLDRRSP